ncbi:hypothetical protein V7111_10340 [Neobacillus niacini]
MSKFTFLGQIYKLNEEIIRIKAEKEQEESEEEVEEETDEEEA